MEDTPLSVVALLRQTRALLSDLPATWAPSPAEAAALREAAELLRQVVARAAESSSADEPALRLRRQRPSPKPRGPMPTTPSGRPSG